MNSFHQSKKAFSLIEVLVALAIFTMAATVLMSAFVNALTVRERSMRKEQLRNDVEAVRLQLLLEPNREDAEDGGDFQTLNHGEAMWRSVIESTEIVDLFLVEFSVEFSDPPEDGATSYTEMLYLLRPTWSEADERSDLLEDKREALMNSRRFGAF